MTAAERLRTRRLAPRSRLLGAAGRRRPRRRHAPALSAWDGVAALRAVSRAARAGWPFGASPPACGMASRPRTQSRRSSRASSSGDRHGRPRAHRRHDAGAERLGASVQEGARARVTGVAPVVSLLHALQVGPVPLPVARLELRAPAPGPVRPTIEGRARGDAVSRMLVRLGIALAVLLAALVLSSDRRRRPPLARYTPAGAARGLEGRTSGRAASCSEGHARAPDHPVVSGGPRRPAALDPSGILTGNGGLPWSRRHLRRHRGPVAARADGRRRVRDADLADAPPRARRRGALGPRAWQRPSPPGGDRARRGNGQLD